MLAPATPADTERIADALVSIASIADDMMNCINAAAEEVGCNWQDPRRAARRAARRAQLEPVPPAQ